MQFLVVPPKSGLEERDGGIGDGDKCTFTSDRTTGTARGERVAWKGHFCRIHSQFGNLCQHAGLSPWHEAFPTGREWQNSLPSWDLSFLTRRAHLALLPWHPRGPVPAISSIPSRQTLAPVQARGPRDARLP